MTGAASLRFDSAPTLETERLILREYRRDDRLAQHRLVADDEVMRPVGVASGLSMEDAWRRSVASVGMWKVMGFGGWVVIRKDDRRLIGIVSLFTAWRNLLPAFGDDPEMGWIFERAVHGQGYAGEACRAVIDWATANLDPTPIWAIINPDNGPSQTLATRLGFQRLPDSIYNGESITVWKRLAA